MPVAVADYPAAAAAPLDDDRGRWVCYYAAFLCLLATCGPLLASCADFVAADVMYTPTFAVNASVVPTSDTTTSTNITTTTTTTTATTVTGTGRMRLNAFHYHDTFPVVTRITSAIDGTLIHETNGTYRSKLGAQPFSCTFAAYSVVTCVDERGYACGGRERVELSMPGCGASLVLRVCLYVLYEPAVCSSVQCTVRCACLHSNGGYVGVGS